VGDGTGISWTDATGRKLGALKRLASRAGVTLDVFATRCSAGEKWCWRCKEWHSRGAFGADSSRYDGLDPACLASRNTSARDRYVPRGPAGRRGWLAATRDGDKKQARRRVNYLVEQGMIPRPADLPCVDCADEIPGGGRHEYDHARGYDGENQLYVEPVCQRCHRNREEARYG
jgi:hypothetical protein